MSWKASNKAEEDSGNNGASNDANVQIRMQSGGRYPRPNAGSITGSLPAFACNCIEFGLFTNHFPECIISSQIVAESLIPEPIRFGNYQTMKELQSSNGKPFNSDTEAQVLANAKNSWPVLIETTFC